MSTNETRNNPTGHNPTEPSATEPAGSIRPDPSTHEGRDVLIARVIDAEASAEDWRAFRALAEHDPDVWRDLADAQQQHELLCEGVAAAVGVADRVALPLSRSDATPLQRRLDTTARWGGWAAAAALVLVWATGLPGPGEDPGIQGASLLRSGPSLSDATPDEALARYLDAGRSVGVVVGEVPEQLVVETHARDDGTIEVLYLRQIVERRITSRVYRETRDDTGRIVPVPVPVSDIVPARRY